MEKKLTMKDYILKTPDQVLENLNRIEELVKPLADLYLRKSYRNIVIAASGSSYTAAQCARIFLSETLHTDVKIVTPYNFAHYDYKLLRDDDFFVLISQSGASSNGVEVLKKLKEIGHECVSLTSTTECDFKEYSDYIFPWGCGHEQVGYVTLGVVTLIEYLMLFAMYTAQKAGFTSSLDLETGKAQIRQAMENHRAISKQTQDFVEANIKALTSMRKVYVCGCGTNYGTALEGALKIGETVKVLAVGYELDEVLHGPALQLDPSFTIFLIDGMDETSKHASDLYAAATCVSDHVFTISNDPNINDQHAMRVPNPCMEPFSCMYNLPFFEMIAYCVSEKTGSWENHPLYYEMNAKVDFRTANYRRKVPAKDE